MSRVLIIAAHGSRLAASNDEIRQLAAALEPVVAGRYQRVDAAFLELADPSIAAAIDAAVAAGARDIAVLPYFLAAGRHVSRDLPRLVKDRQQAHPAISIRLLDYLGRRPELLQLLAKSV